MQRTKPDSKWIEESGRPLDELFRPLTKWFKWKKKDKKKIDK